MSSQCGNVTDAEERKRILMRSGRWFVCLKRNHRAQECRSSLKCLTCGKRHHVTICGASSSKGASNPPLPKQQQSTPSPSTPQPQTQKATPTSRSVLSMFVDVRTPVLLQTAKVVSRVQARCSSRHPNHTDDLRHWKPEVIRGR